MFGRQITLTIQYENSNLNMVEVFWNMFTPFIFKERCSGRS